MIHTPVDASFQIVHIIRVLHIPLPGVSEIFATSMPLHSVVFMTIFSAGTSVSFEILVPIPKATFVRFGNVRTVLAVQNQENH